MSMLWHPEAERRIVEVSLRSLSFRQENFLVNRSSLKWCCQFRSFDTSEKYIKESICDMESKNTDLQSRIKKIGEWVCKNEIFWIGNWKQKFEKYNWKNYLPLKKKMVMQTEKLLWDNCMNLATTKRPTDH